MFKRGLALPEPGVETFFLWGPRQTGKSTLLREAYGQARWVDLLKAEEFRRYLARPERLRQEVEAEPPSPGAQIVVDEIQKVPALLDEVHWLIENRGLHFALCGSSARKVKRGAANLLGGRALRYELHGLTASELGRDFQLDRMLNHGYLPRIYEGEPHGQEPLPDPRRHLAGALAPCVPQATEAPRDPPRRRFRAKTLGGRSHLSHRGARLERAGIDG